MDIDFDDGVYDLITISPKGSKTPLSKRDQESFDVWNEIHDIYLESFLEQ